MARVKASDSAVQILKQRVVSRTEVEIRIIIHKTDTDLVHDSFELRRLDEALVVAALGHEARVVQLFVADAPVNLAHLNVEVVLALLRVEIETVGLCQVRDVSRLVFVYQYMLGTSLIALCINLRNIRLLSSRHHFHSAILLLENRVFVGSALLWSAEVRIRLVLGGLPGFVINNGVEAGAFV